MVAGAKRSVSFQLVLEDRLGWFAEPCRASAFKAIARFLAFALCLTAYFLAPAQTALPELRLKLGSTSPLLYTGIVTIPKPPNAVPSSVSISPVDPKLADASLTAAPGPSATDGKSFAVTVTATNSLPVRRMNARLNVAVMIGKLPATLQTYDLTIVAEGAHALSQTANPKHVYVVDESTSQTQWLIKGMLGLKEPPDDILRIQLQNGSALASSVGGARIYLYDANGAPVDASALQAHLASSAGPSNAPRSPGSPEIGQIPGNGSNLITVDLAPAHLEAGSYSGSLLLDAVDPASATLIGFKLDVRHYPIGVVVLMVVFTIAGYLVYWLQGLRQSYNQQLDAIEESLCKLTNVGENVLEVMKAQLAALRDRVDPHRDDHTIRSFFTSINPWAKNPEPDPSLDAALPGDIGNLRAAIGVAAGLSKLADRATGTLKDQPDRLDVVQAQIAQAWISVVEMSPSTAAMTMSQIEGELFAPDSIVVPPKADPSAPPAAIAAAPPAAPSTTNFVAPHSQRGGMSARKNLKMGSSIRTIQTVRRLTSTIGILILFAIGFNVLYVSVPGFGQSFYDYIKVIAWSFGTGAAGRGLSTTIGNWAQSLML